MLLASVLVRFKGVERVRRIVAEFPGDTGQEQYQIFYGAGTSPVAHQLCVSFDQIRILIFAGMVVMQEVVFTSPGSGQNPVEPIDEAPPAPGKSLARITRSHAGHPVVAAVTDVMHEEPASENPLRDESGTDRIGNDPGGGIAEQADEVSEPLYLDQMKEVLVAERLEGVPAKRLKFSGKTLVIYFVE